MTTGLILVDIQNEYFPGGRMELAGIDKAAANAKAKAFPQQLPQDAAAARIDRNGR